MLHGVMRKYALHNRKARTYHYFHHLAERYLNLQPLPLTLSWWILASALALRWHASRS
jgi:hypothetical protein